MLSMIYHRGHDTSVTGLRYSGITPISSVGSTRSVFRTFLYLFKEYVDLNNKQRGEQSEEYEERESHRT